MVEILCLGALEKGRILDPSSGQYFSGEVFQREGKLVSAVFVTKYTGTTMLP